MTPTSRPVFSSASVRLDSNCSGSLADLRNWARLVAKTSTDLELVLTELVGNAKQHGEDGPITIEVQTGIDTAVVTVTNTSVPPPPLPPLDANPLETSSPRGRGLQIATAIADELKIHQDGPNLTVTAEMPLQ